MTNSPFSATDGDIIGADMVGDVLVLWTRCAWLFTDLNDNVLDKGRLLPNCKRELMKVKKKAFLLMQSQRAVTIDFTYCLTRIGYHSTLANNEALILHFRSSLLLSTTSGSS